VERGVSATFGNTAEPYLRFTHQFNLFFAALAEGWNFGDAAYMALPALSWQNVAIGDPLFRPFAVGLEEQWKAIGNPLHILSDQYVVLRRINLLLAAGETGEALRVANRGMRETPGPALALKRAELLEADEQPEAARKGLAFLAELDPEDSMDWGLYAEIADTLLRLGDAKAALKLYRKLERQSMPEKVQLAFLKRGIHAAEEAGNSGLAIEWRTRVTPPPPPPKPEDSVPVDADQGGS
jgi:tetratricopeptide (TPR) repeat protein